MCIVNAWSYTSKMGFRPGLNITSDTRWPTECGKVDIVLDQICTKAEHGSVQF